MLYFPVAIKFLRWLWDWEIEWVTDQLQLRKWFNQIKSKNSEQIKLKKNVCDCVCVRAFLSDSDTYKQK